MLNTQSKVTGVTNMVTWLEGRCIKTFDVTKIDLLFSDDSFTPMCVSIVDFIREYSDTYLVMYYIQNSDSDWSGL